MKIRILTADPNLVSALVGETTPLIARPTKPFPSVTVVCDRFEATRDPIFGYLIDLTVSFSVGVAASAVANWLTHKLSSRTSKVRINRRTVNLENGNLKSVIEEQILSEPPGDA